MNDNMTTNVVVGRFQNPTLTEDQKALLNYSLQTSYKKPTVVLGLSPLKCTAANPLDYEARKSMIESEYPNKFNFKYIKDQNSDAKWSENFDDIVSQCVTTASNSTAENCVKIIGSKDGFLDHYTGTYKDNFEEHTQTTYSSAVEQTKTYACNMKNSSDWRTGVAYAMNAQYPTVYPTVDCAIFDKDDYKQIYLARKKDEDLYRFVGGFADPKDDSFEDSALREAKEETGLTCREIKYLFSQKIDDFRYRNETSKIITHMFVMVKESGRAKANDDICELKLFDLDTLTENMVQPEHRILLKRLLLALRRNTTAVDHTCAIDSRNYYDTHTEADTAVKVMYDLYNKTTSDTATKTINFDKFIEELSNRGVSWKHPDVMNEIRSRYVLSDAYDKWLKTGNNCQKNK